MLVPRDYLIQLAQIERNAGLIESRSGKNGGYILAKPANEITLLEVMNAINGNESELHEAKDSGSHSKHADNSMTDMLNAVFSSHTAFLESITLDMLSKCLEGTMDVEVYLADRLNAESQRLTQSLTPA